MIRKVHDMIINDVKKDLPKLKDLALQMGTNEFKLKYGFKQLYGTTIFKFLVQERLRKAKTLIQYTSLSIKTIAHMTGFKSIPHFSRAFKEKYGKSPSDLRE
jgi:AraC-like DNA-binding protein